MSSDITDNLLNGCSPYIYSITYDIGKRCVEIVVVDNGDSQVPYLRITVANILHYEEVTIDDEPDDNCMDSIIGVHWVREGRLCIRTEKKEIMVNTPNEPSARKIA